MVCETLCKVTHMRDLLGHRFQCRKLQHTPNILAARLESNGVTFGDMLPQNTDESPPHKHNESTNATLTNATEATPRTGMTKQVSM